MHILRTGSHWGKLEEVPSGKGCTFLFIDGWHNFLKTANDDFQPLFSESENSKQQENDSLLIALSCLMSNQGVYFCEKYCNKLNIVIKGLCLLDAPEFVLWQTWSFTWIFIQAVYKSKFQCTEKQSRFGGIIVSRESSLWIDFQRSTLGKPSGDCVLVLSGMFRSCSQASGRPPYVPHLHLIQGVTPSHQKCTFDYGVKFPKHV